MAKKKATDVVKMLEKMEWRKDIPILIYNRQKSISSIGEIK